jgi:hypothetical protein
LRRTRYVAVQTLADLGLRGATVNGPAWLWDNPFLLKTSRTETRRFGLSLRLLVAVTVLSLLLLTGLWLNQTYPARVVGALRFLFASSFPAALFVVLTFTHTMLISTARAAQAASLGDEARRGTLPDLLLTPLRRAEMLLAMGVGPARTAFWVALAGLPLYILLGQMGALTVRDIFFLYLLFAILSYAPATYAFPALAGGVLTPDTEIGKFAITRSRRPTGRSAGISAALPGILGFLFFGQAAGLLGGGWFAHLLTALHLHFNSGMPFLLFFAWPYYAMQLLSGQVDFFHLTLSPLLFVVPWLFVAWAASALGSAVSLSAGDLAEMNRLPQGTRARTLARWTARAMGLCALGVVWKAWVESGDTATLVGAYGVPGADAAGLLLLLCGLSLPKVCWRALMLDPIRADTSYLRSPFLVLRRAFKRSPRPLWVAGGTFLLACALGGLSPFAPLVYQVAGQIALAGVVSVLWAVGIRRAVLPTAKDKSLHLVLLYGLPVGALSLPVPGASLLAALSPATAWLNLFPQVPGLLHKLPWAVAAPPSFSTCVIGAALVGAALLVGTGRTQAALPPSPFDAQKRHRTKPVFSRNLRETAALMGWVTAHTDNPLFTYELRTRTRTGYWADWRYYAPLALLVGLIVSAAYPEIVGIVSAISPLHFFGGFRLAYQVSRLPADVLAQSRADLAALLLALQCYLLGFRGQAIGEGLIARDRQRGIWGFILLTPLTARQIFWGKVAGQTALSGATWMICGLGSLILYAFAAPSFGLFPALAAWLVGQVFVAALFLLGFSLGAALSTYPIFSKGLRGLPGLLFTVLAGFGAWAQLHWLPWNTPGDWSLLAGRLLLGSGYALVLAAPLLAFALWRIEDVRRRDVTLGDGME